MGPLRNVRRERFCLALAEGRSLSESYTLAGYSGHRQNAHRMMTFDDIRERLAELQSQMAQDNKITVQSVCRELDEAIAIAKERGQAAALVNAASLRSRLGGLLTDKTEVKITRSEDEDTTIEEVLGRISREVSPQAAVLLGQAFSLEICPDGEILDISGSVSKPVGNINNALGLGPVPQRQSKDPRVIEWQPPRNAKRDI